MTLVVLLVSAMPLAAHNFTMLAADLIQDGDELSMTINITPLDAVAIITDSPTTSSAHISHAELRAGSAAIKAYLVKHIRLRVGTQDITGSCLGYIPDLLAPDSPPSTEPLPDKLPYLIIWTLPKGATSCDITFDLLLDLVGSGVVHAALHNEDDAAVQYLMLGESAHFTLKPTAEAATTPNTTDPTTNPQPGVTTPITAPANTSPERVVTRTLSAWELLSLGFKHIMPEGLDHILFVVCLFLLSPKIKPLLVQVTAFTVAHSITLGLAMVGIVLLPSQLVETLIALSIVVMAVENLFIRTVKPWRWALVFLFGLVHGLGFAGSFSALELAPGDTTRSLLLLNCGIELGQLSVVGGCALLTCWCWRREWYTRAVVYPASTCIALVAAWWTIQRAFGL